MNEREKAVVTEKWRDLVRSIDVRNVIDILIQAGVISFEESEQIRNGDTKPEQARRMITKVVHSQMPNVFEVFMEALQENYDYLVHDIRSQLCAEKRRRFSQKRQKATTDPGPIQTEERFASRNPVELSDRYLSEERHVCSGYRPDANSYDRTSTGDETSTKQVVDSDIVPTMEAMSVSPRPLLNPQTSDGEGHQPVQYSLSTRSVMLMPRGDAGSSTSCGFLLEQKTDDAFIVGHVLPGQAAVSTLVRGDEIISINGMPCRNLTIEKAYEEMNKPSLKQLWLRVRSPGRVQHEDLRVSLSRPNLQQSWGLRIVHGTFRARYPNDTEFYCSEIVANSPAEQQGVIRVGDSLLSCNGQSLAEKTREEVYALLTSVNTIELCIRRENFWKAAR